MRLRQLVSRDPRQFGCEQSRWTLSALHTVCGRWLRVGTLAGLWGVLRRLQVRLKRGRLYVHSPDPGYAHKLARLKQVVAQVRQAPQRWVLVYLDEVSYTRQPSLACDYAACGPTQPLARLSHAADREYRVLGALDGLTGRVLYRQRRHIRRTVLIDFWYQLRAAYPEAEQIYVVVDNWPVHFHPDVLAVLHPQPYRSDFRLPPNWSSAPSAHVKRDGLPITLVPLPTYASWLNPIEKLWRKLRQQIVHLHRQADDWPGLKQRVARFLDGLAHGSPALLHYVGLLPI
jgi:hypothetical protein